MTIETLLVGIFAGVAATATMDFMAIAAHKLGLTVGAKGQWVGRWYLGFLRGRFAYADITAEPELPGEARAAFLGHYAIGVVLGVLYVAGAGWLDMAPNRILPALGYGLATTVFPWFLLFPCMGFGFFGMKGPRELKLFRTSLVNHLGYGFGLWWATAVIAIA